MESRKEPRKEQRKKDGPWRKLAKAVLAATTVFGISNNPANSQVLTPTLKEAPRQLYKNDRRIHSVKILEATIIGSLTAPLTKDFAPRLEKIFKGGNFTLDDQIEFFENVRFVNTEEAFVCLRKIAKYIHPKLLLLTKAYKFKIYKPETSFIKNYADPLFKFEASQLKFIYELFRNNPKFAIGESDDLKSSYDQAIWANRIFHSLKAQDRILAVNNFTLETEYAKIKHGQEKFGNLQTIEKNSRVTVFANSEKQGHSDNFGKKPLLNELAKLTGAEGYVKRVNYKNETQEEIETLFTERIVNTDIAIFSGHGGEQNTKSQKKISFYFTNGQIIQDGKNSLIAPGIAIDSETIAKALIKRDRLLGGNGKTMKIIFDACMQGGIFEQLQNYFDIENKKRLSNKERLMDEIIGISSGGESENTIYDKSSKYGSDFMELLVLNPNISDYYDSPIPTSTVTVHILNSKDNQYPRKLKLGEAKPNITDEPNTEKS